MKRSNPEESNKNKKKKKLKRDQSGHLKKDKERDDDHIELIGPNEQEVAQMKKVMGFTEFDSTKGRMVPGNQVGSVHVVRKRHYRQYMNRKGGFNRPLDKVA